MTTATEISKRSILQKSGLISGPLLFFIILMIPMESGNPLVVRMAAVAALMAVFWATEAIPLAATSLIPIVLFPVLGIMTGKATASVYSGSTIFLFMGGFLIALAMENWNLHKRIALLTVKTIGGGPQRIVFGFMVASAFLSMWISNTATAVMMLPIGLSIIMKMEEQFGEKASHNFALTLLLGIAYTASMGGLATLVGTPPNLVLVSVFEQTFPNAPAIDFGGWIVMALPLSLIMIGVIWFLLTKVFFKIPSHICVDQDIIQSEYKALGPLTVEEKRVLIVFSITALLWIFRKGLNLGFVTISGWSTLIPFSQNVDDGTVAIFMAMTLFFIPTKGSDAATPTLLDAAVFKRLPWSIILLFGGGFALAKGFQVSGLSLFIGSKLVMLEGTPPFIMVSGICTMLTFLTEITSNTATTQMILPVLSSIAVAVKTNPLIYLIPATLSASCAFMMPIATPPNAIVFGSGRIRIFEMVKAGLYINLVGIVMVTSIFYLIGTLSFSIDLSIFPDWAFFVAD